MSKKSMKSMHESLSKGHIPEELVLIAWEDITQFDHCNLGDNSDLINFHSGGVLVNVTKDKLDLQQTWIHNDGKAETIATSPSNLLLALPKGVIKRIYRYKLVLEEEEKKKD